MYQAGQGGSQRLQLKIAKQILWNVGRNWKARRLGIHIKNDLVVNNQVCSFMWADNHWIMSHNQENEERMKNQLVEEVERWDMEPKSASLWWTSTCAKEGKQDMVIETAGGKHIPLRISGHLFSRDGGKQISLEQRMRCANKAWWRDASFFFRCNDVPWKIKCQRVFDRVFSVFCFGCEVLRVREMELEQGNDGQDLRTGNEDFTKSVQDVVGGRNGTGPLLQDSQNGEKLLETKMKFTLLTDLIAEGTWRTMEWSNREKKNAVQQTLEHVFRGHWELHEHTRDGTTGDASGTKLRPLGRETKNGCYNEKKRRTQKDKKDL